MGNDRANGYSGLSDAGLVGAVRAGQSDALGELWRRHYSSAVAVAAVASCSGCTAFSAEDIVQESFVAIHKAIRDGAGPTQGFRNYLLTTVRHTAGRWGRMSREYASDRIEEVSGVNPPTSSTRIDGDRQIVRSAFSSLPRRWQEVLWYTEVEQKKPAAIAPLMGMSPLAVAQLAFRARAGLRAAWITAHLRPLVHDQRCLWTVSRLAAYSLGSISQRDAGRAAAHLAGCVECSTAAEEAELVSADLQRR